MPFPYSQEPFGCFKQEGKKLLKTLIHNKESKKICQFFNWLKPHGLDSDITWFLQLDGERASLPVPTCPPGAPDKAEARVAERQPTYCTFFLPDIRLQNGNTFSALVLLPVWMAPLVCAIHCCNSCTCV